MRKRGVRTETTSTPAPGLLQEADRVLQALGQFADVEGADPGRRELDRQRQPVKPAADGRDMRSRGLVGPEPRGSGPCSIQEEPPGGTGQHVLQARPGRHSERPQGQDTLGIDSERLAARGLLVLGTAAMAARSAMARRRGSR